MALLMIFQKTTKMNKNNNTLPSSIDALRSERLELRNRASVLEAEIKDTYQEIKGNVKPVFDVIQKVKKIKNSFTISKNDNIEGGSPGINIVKLLVPAATVLAGGAISKIGRKILIKSLIVYGIGSAAKYVFSKSLSEHKETAQNLFHRKKETADGIF